MENRYFVKFCGITNTKDALNAQTSGCDALGFVFVKQSKRYITAQKCHEIIQKISPNILVVALFANNTQEEIQEVLNNCAVHVLQFHGAESVGFCRGFNRPYWKAIPMADVIDPVKYAQKYPDAQAYLIDNFGNKSSGGSGEKFNWSLLPKNLGNKWILAGGLNIDNIEHAKKTTGLQNYDVSSGIEKQAGIKSHKKMKQFIKKLK